MMTVIRPIQITAARPAQLTAIVQLLNLNHLPADDLPEGLPNFWLAVDRDELVGSAGFEVHGNIGLLRSVCVASTHRNQHLARQLLEVVYEQARSQSIREFYLLTTTADRYFERLGFTRVDRSDVPDSIRQTTQFSALCPSSAIVMKQTL